MHQPTNDYDEMIRLLERLRTGAGITDAAIAQLFNESARYRQFGPPEGWSERSVCQLAKLHRVSKRRGRPTTAESTQNQNRSRR